jgi:enamine deaminase RidA (YjgF/YER057c/UK114 family)
MIKALSLAAALAVLPLSAALAADPQTAPQTSAADAAEAAIEAAAERFEARMDAYGERAEAIADDDSLTAEQKTLRIAAVWAEYQPDVAAFTAVVSEHVGGIAGAALADIDIEGIVAEALSAVEESGALQAASGMAANGAWASNDPEHMATYGLMAQYAVGEALDAVDEATAGEISVHLDAAAETAAAVAPSKGDAD